VRDLLTFFLCLLAFSGRPMAQSSEPPVPMARFVGTWVGTQSWAIADPPPGSRQDQPVTLVIESVNGTLRGTMTPFLGGEDGATFSDVTIVGNQLHALATAGRPRGPSAGWKAPVKVAFAFRNEGLALTGSADVKMGDVPWMKYSYELSRKRSRY
jgi:hypothetical protein